MRLLPSPRTLAPLFFLAIATSAACSSTSGDGASSSSSSSSGGSSGSSGDPNDPNSSSSSSSGGQDGSVKPDDVKITQEQIDVGGQSRRYTLAVPVDYDAGKTYPLVLSFHGDGGTGAGMQQWLPFEEASKREAILAYPDGIGQTWNLDTTDTNNADVQFIRALVDALANKYSIDKNRVLANGYSNGGFFINEVACRGGYLFKAIASHAGGAPWQDRPGTSKDGNGFLSCPNDAIPAFIFHGDADNGVEVGSGTWNTFYWSHVSGCTDPRTGDNTPTTPRAPAPCKQYDGCSAGKPVTWCLFPGVGHVVANGAQQIAWDYFKALP